MKKICLLLLESIKTKKNREMKRQTKCLKPTPVKAQIWLTR